MEYFIVGWFVGLMTCWVVDKVREQATKADRRQDEAEAAGEFPNHRPIRWE